MRNTKIWVTGSERWKRNQSYRDLNFISDTAARRIDSHRINVTNLASELMWNRAKACWIWAALSFITFHHIIILFSEKSYTSIRVFQLEGKSRFISIRSHWQTIQKKVWSPEINKAHIPPRDAAVCCSFHDEEFLRQRIPTKDLPCFCLRTWDNLSPQHNSMRKPVSMEMPWS